MTPEQLHSHLSTNPGKSYATLDAEARTIMRLHLRPGSDGFTQQQRDWLQDFYLIVPTQEVFATLEAVLPPGLGLSLIDTLDGWRVLNADLLTDCLQPSDNWTAIAQYLATLEIRFIAPDKFPVPDDLTP